MGLQTNGGGGSEPRAVAESTGVSPAPSSHLPSALPPAQAGSYPSPLPGVRGDRPWFLHSVSPILPPPIPLATRPDPSRRRAWQLCRERLMARKEGGAWREARQGSEPQRGVVPSCLGGHREEEAPLPCNAEGAGSQGAALLTASARDPARSPRPASPAAQLLSSGSIQSRPNPTGEPWSPQQQQPHSSWQMPQVSAPWLLQTVQAAYVHSWAPCACVLEAI